MTYGSSRLNSSLGPGSGYDLGPGSGPVYGFLQVFLRCFFDKFDIAL